MITNTFVRGKFDTAREAAFGAITSSFTQVGTAFEAPFSIYYCLLYTSDAADE